MESDGTPILPMQLGILTLISVGTVEWSRPKFHTQKYIFPIGYTVRRHIFILIFRTYPSLLYADRHTRFTCTIEDGGEGPRFVLTPEDQPDTPIIAATPTGAWTAAMRRANDLRNRSTTNSASGPEYFGLANPVITYLIQNLPNARSCENYQPVMFEKNEWSDPNSAESDPLEEIEIASSEE